MDKRTVIGFVYILSVVLCEDSSIGESNQKVRTIIVVAHCNTARKSFLLVVIPV